MVGIKDEGVLHVALIAVRVDIDTVERLLLVAEDATVVGLSALAFLVEEAETAVEDIVSGLAEPSVLKVELPGLRVIDETILVGVMFLEVVLIMSQHLRAEPFREMNVAVDVGLHTAHSVAIEVDVQRLVVLRL